MVRSPLAPADASCVTRPTDDQLKSRSPGPVRIIAVDDNQDALELTASALEHFGHEVYTASDGPTALELAAKVKPRLALLDIGLPMWDGYELARRLRDVDATIKLVALTGYGGQADVKKSQAAGFDAHLVKPIPLDVLKSTIEELCGL